MLGPFRRPPPRGHDRVHEPGSVQVHGQVVLASPARDLGDALDRVNPAAARDCGCFPGRPAASGRSGRRAWAGWRRADVFERQDPAVALEGPRGHAREPGDPAGLPDVDVRRRGAQSSSSPGCVFTPTPIWLAIVPEGTNTAASLPSSSAVRASRSLTVGSSPIDVVADLRLGHRPPHRRESAWSPCRNESRSEVGASSCSLAAKARSDSARF